MERDFLGLNSKDSVVVVKEEAVEECKDLAFWKGSGVQWPSANKVSSLPHFLSFKVAQEEKSANNISDPLASSGFMALSTADAFDTTHKHYLGEMQKFHNGQGGTPFTMTTYPMQRDALSMHLPQDVKMLSAANQPVSVTVGNPFFKTHFACAGQNFASAVAAPHSILPSVGSVAGTSEPWSSSKVLGVPAQLTIFYGGTVKVYDGVSPEKAQAIMFLAGNGSTVASNMEKPKAQVQVPAFKQPVGDGVLVNQPNNTPPGPGLSSPISVSSHPAGQSGSGSSTNDEVMAAKSAGVSSTPVGKVDTAKTVTSLGPLAATTMITSAVPQARKASLARFLEKRKERAMNASPYSVCKRSTENPPPGWNGSTSAVSAGASAGSLNQQGEQQL